MPLRNLPIFWKLLLPFLVLLLVVGTSGTFIMVRDLSSRSTQSLSEHLTLRAVEARSLIHDRELYLLESANYASNLNGMAASLRRTDSDATRHLLQSVVALKTDLRMIAATTPSGTSVVELVRPSAGGEPVQGAATDWATFEPIRRAVQRSDGSKTPGFVRLADRTLMVMVAPVCASAPPCDLAGFTIVGLDTAAIVKQSVREVSEVTGSPQEVTLFDQSQGVLASTSTTPPPPLGAPPKTTEIEQRRATLGGTRVVTAYTGFKLAGQPAGTIALTLPASSGATSAGPAAARLVALIVVAMLLAALAGAAVSSVILRQLRALVDTSRRLGEGQLSTRAPVLSEDEHGELAMTLNRMAEQLEASHETLELQVEQRTQEIHRLLQDRTEFFAGLSHELRTPIAIILTQADMLLNGGGNKVRTEAGEAIRLSAAQLLEVVNDILDLARAEAGSLDVDLDPVRLPDFFAGLQPLLTNVAAASGITVDVRIPKRLPPVIADEARLREVVINLVDNAVKYTPAGGRIEIGAHPEGEVVSVSIADTGVGIPDEIGDRVFEPFYRVTGTLPQRGQASSGLGLALVRRWVEAQGGTITWAPNPVGGTIFTFTLPTLVGPEGGTRSSTRRRGHTERLPVEPGPDTGDHPRPPEVVPTGRRRDPRTGSVATAERSQA